MSSATAGISSVLACLLGLLHSRRGVLQHLCGHGVGVAAVRARAGHHRVLGEVARRHRDPLFCAHYCPVIEGTILS